jgi:hypothetical protein
MKLTFKSIIVVVLALSVNIAMAEEIALARAAELACHRIERLVTLRKVEESYLNNFSSLKIDLLTQETPEAPRFKVTGKQFGVNEVSGKEIILFLNNDGRAQSHTLIDGQITSGPVWSTKDPVTLVENSLHFVIENGVSNPDISTFLNQLSELSLTQEVIDGQNLAKVEMKNYNDAKKLIILLNLEGEFIRYEILL